MNNTNADDPSEGNENATHIIECYDVGGDVSLVYVNEDKEDLNRIIHLCEGGGHVLSVIDRRTQESVSWPIIYNK
jgi:hypothetical protein